MHELRELEVWTRTEALPVIITGIKDRQPIPQQLAISRGYEGYADAFAVARATPVAVRQEQRGKGEDYARTIRPCGH
ncbi:MAG: hypothetical protein JWO49_2653 [Arthrobacter sp.]|nr:hypothetical protein [Arthrobacter sp.]